jgi:hypothetical protein
MSKKESESQEFLLSIDKTVKELLLSIESDLPVAQRRLAKFIEAFNKEFPLDIKLEDRGRAEAIAWALMNVPLLLYALNMNGSAIIELHGILERFALREIVIHLGVPFRIFERHHLPELALILRDLKIFDKEDVKFSKKLNRLRNGLAHKNPRVISNVVYSGKKISVLDIDSVMTKFDCTPLIIRTIHLLVKTSKAKYPN